MERRAEAVRVDGDGRVHRGKVKPVHADLGANQTRLHPTQNAKNKGIITPVVYETLH